MTTVNLIYKEIVHRKLNFLLSLLAVVTAVALFVTFFTSGQASNRETARLMRDMGFNIRIIPARTDMSKFWITGFSDHTMPEKYIELFASQKSISYNHLVATLEKKILWQDTEIILTGLAPEICPPDRKKPAMAFEIEQGTVYAGYELGQKPGLKRGDSIDIRGKTLTVAKILSESGSTDDIRIQCHLRDAQTILNLPGQINEIKAIDCLCFVPTDNPLAILRSELAAVLPDAKVVQMKSMAQARTRQRQMAQKYFQFIVPFVVVVCGAWIGALAMINVRDRLREIGIIRAIGYGLGRVVLLFLGKSVLTGFIGAVVGFFAGTAVALAFGPEIFKITAGAIRPEYSLLGWSMIAAPLFAAVSSFVPTMFAVAADPADILRCE